MSVYQALGDQLHNTRTLRQIVQEWEARIELDSSNPSLYVAAAEALDSCGYFQKAFSFLTKAQTLDPSGTVVAEFRTRRYYHHDHHSEGCSACDALCGLCVLDSCCECMGGDLIECC